MSTCPLHVTNFLQSNNRVFARVLDASRRPVFRGDVSTIDRSTRHLSDSSQVSLVPVACLR